MWFYDPREHQRNSFTAYNSLFDGKWVNKGGLHFMIGTCNFEKLAILHATLPQHPRRWPSPQCCQPTLFIEHHTLVPVQYRLEVKYNRY